MSAAEHEAYFRQLLGDVTEPTAPFGLLNVRGDGSGIDEARFQVDASLAEQLRSQARRLGVSAASVFHVAWAQVLARVSGRADVVFGTVLFGRMHGESERMFGLLINTLPVRLRIADLSAVGAVRSMHEQLAEMLLHDLAPLSLAQRCSGVPAPKPLFSSLLNYRHSKRVARRKQAWEGIRQLRGDVRTSYPLMFAVDDFEDGFQLKAQVEHPVGAERVCGYMHTALTSLVEALERRPHRPVHALEVLPLAERRQIVDVWNVAPEAVPASAVPLAAVFEAHVRLSPEAAVVVCEDGTLTYGELNVRANQVAHQLRGLGVRPDARVALCADRGIELIVGLLAVLKAGGAYVPLDPTYPEARLRGMLVDSAPVVLLADAHTRARCAALAASLPILDLTDAASWRGQPTSDPDHAAVGVTPEHLAYVIYTSGSTGTPKGVMVSQRAVAQYVAAIQSKLTLSPGANCGWVSTVAADLGYTMLFPALLGGGVLHVVPSAVSTDAERFAAYNRAHALEYLKITPSHFHALFGDGHTADAIPMRGLVFGGDILSASLVAMVHGLRPGCRIYNHYGPTECTVGALADRLTATTLANGPVPLGHPLGAACVTIMDQSGHLVPVGVVGEIYIGGAGVARGYLQRPDMTAEHFVPDPFAAAGGARMYRTGDRGRWRADGRVDFLGRTDRQVKVRGYRIELAEIEARLRMHAAVRDVVVVARAEADGDLQLIAYFTDGQPEAGARVEGDALRAHLLSSLPEHMVPAVWVPLDALPLTANGKVDVSSLPAPEAVTAPSTPEYEAPIGEIETTVARVWAEVLKHERVSRRDNFFELGGHSLLAVRVIARLRQAGIRADIGALFATPTLADLAAAIDPAATGVSVPPNRIPDGCTAITPEMLPLVGLTADEVARIIDVVPGGAANVQDIYPLAPLQEGILFHALFEGAGDPYVLGSLYSFESRARLDAYLAALQAVIARHDILRTAFLWEGLPEPVQVVWRQAPLPTEEVTLDEEGGDVAAALYARYDPRRHGLDLRQAPLMRVAVAWDAAEGRWLLMHVQHHLIGDHVTTDAICTEIEAHLVGEDASLPAPRPFRNLVAQARLGMSAAEHEAYFRQLLGDVTEPTAPFGLLNVHGAVGAIETARVRLPAELSARLRAQARGLGVSAASLFHVAWAQVLARVSGRADVVFGTVLFGRMQGDEGAEQAFGLFMNTLPVRLRIEDDGAAEAVRAMHAQLAALLRHEHAPLALAQRCSAVPAPTPLFSSLLNYRYGRQVDAAARRASEGIREIRSVGRTNYPVALSVDDLGESFHVAAEVTPEVEAGRVVAYMQTALTSLVEALERAPERQVRTLEVLPEADRQQLVYEWNATEAVYPDMECLPALFETAARATPDAVAVVCDDHSLTYRALQAEAAQLAVRLRDLGVQPDTLVAISVERSLDLMIGVLGILLAGGAYLPLDLSYPVTRLQAMVEDSAPVALLTCGPLPERLHPLAAQLPILDLGNGWREQAHDAVGVVPGWVGGGLTPEHLAYVIYTSGSTGQPKGVMVAQRSVVNRLTWMQRGYGLGPGDTVLQKTPITFDVSVWELLWPVLVGARLVMARPEGHKDPVYLCDTIVRHGVTTVHFVPSMFELFLAEPAAARCTPLTRIVCSGEALPGRFVQQSQARLPQATVHNLYGPTEAAVDVTAWTGEAEAGAASVPIGRPMGNVQIYILDRHGVPTPVDVAGELYIGGVQVARGYLHRPALTAERFVSDPFGRVAGGRLYRTGDMARWRADGTIEFLGRTDFQVKLRGQRIELQEIEARLRDHAAVRDVVVVAREVGGDMRLVAYYTATEPPVTDEAEALRAHLAAILPAYMVPAAYVRLERLPITPSGKVDRNALPDAEIQSRREYEPPMGDIEMALADIWREVLKVDRIGRYDDFFALGGHSLLAVRVMARLRQALKVEVAIADLFAHPVLSDLACSLDDVTRSAVPSIAPTERSGRLPLSFAQQRLWFLAQMEGVSEAYHIPLGLRLKGRLDQAALRRALDRILVRHEALRTTFGFIDGEPVQQISPTESSRFLLFEHDLSQHSDALAELNRLVVVEAGASFDFEHGPLIRGRLIRLAEDEHALLLTMHHIVSDGWSMGILVNELSTLYGAFLRGEADPLPELEIQYADYAVWQRQWIEGQILQQQAAYWKEVLAGAAALLELPADHQRPVQQDFAGGFVELVFDERLTAGLKDLSRRHGTTLFMTMLAAWAMLLARLSGQQDLVIGTPAANRTRTEIEQLIGFFVNTLAVRLDLSGSPTVSALLEQVKAQTLAAQQHQDIPFEQVVELANPVRSLAHSPLFQVAFTWQNTTESSLELPGVEIRPLESSPHRVAKFDMTLSLQEAGSTIAGGIEYATSLFEAATIERYLGYFHSLLKAMVADDSHAVDHLPLLSESERDRALYEWNDTKADFPGEQCVHELFEEQVRKTPDATAVVFEDEELSYAELNRRANQLAHYLRELGVGPDARVAICVERGFEMIVALLGVLKAGGAYVPLDPAYPIERLRFMLEDSAPVVLLTQSHLKDNFSGVDAALPVLDLTSATPAWHGLPESNIASDDFGLNRNHLAYVIYTSGSTGQPKGVMVEHRNLANFLWSMQQNPGMESSDVLLAVTTFAFDIAALEFYLPLVVGARLVIVSRDVCVDSARLLKELECEITMMQATPTSWRMLLETGWKGMSGFKVLCGGENLSSNLAENLTTLSSFTWNMYGPTETTVWSLIKRLRGIEDSASIGRPIANTRVYILDGQRQPVPVGVPGELYVGGAGVARGYLHRPALTAERFVSDPFGSSGDRLYRTGDLGCWRANGTIEFLGRTDFQVKIRGYRIELEEIEARLRDHAAVRDVVVVAREVGGDMRLVAYYTGRDREGGDGPGIASALRAYVSVALPDYMVPTAYVCLAALPLTANGKIDRRALPAPDETAFAAAAYEAPLGEIETTVAAIWATVLNREQIGRHDNFFALGGHSLLAVRVMARLRQAGLPVDVRALFAAPTVAALAAAIEPERVGVSVPPNGIPDGCTAITPEMLPLAKLTADEIARIVDAVPGGAGNVQDIYPLAPLQEGILFHVLLGGESDPYLLAQLISFDTRARLDAYLAALQAVIGRHDILRTGVLWEGLREPVQVVWRQALLPTEEVTLDEEGGDVAGALYARYDPRRVRVDVRQAPLLHAAIAWDAAEDRWLLMRRLHHLAGDHVSLEVLDEEIEAHLVGEEARLPMPRPFRNLVAQARLGVSAAEHEAYFRQLLGDVTEPTAPFGLLNVHGDGTGIDEAQLTVEPALARRLRAQARGLGVSAASLFHVAWAQVLARVSGRADVVFGTVLFGRMEVGEERTLGLFMNTLPVRLRIGEGAARMVRSMQQQLAALLQHEHAPLVLAQRCSGVPAPTPLFSSLLNFRYRQRVDATIRRALKGIQGIRVEERTNYPLALSVDDFGDGFQLKVQVIPAVAAGRVAAYMQTALTSLVEALERTPERQVRTLEILPEADRQQLVYEWNATEAVYPDMECLPALFETAAHATPDAVAVVCDETSLTYGALNRRANQVARALQERGVTSGDRVAVGLERGLDLLVALLAVLKSGGVYVPLDLTYPPHRLREILDDSAPAVLLTRRDGPLGDAGACPVLDLQAPAPWDAQPSTDLAWPRSSRELAYIIYTSGSTGRPKGVMVEHRGMINHLWAKVRDLELTAQDRVAQTASPCFDISVWQLLAAVLVGGTTVIVPDRDARDPAALHQTLARADITVFETVPVMLEAMTAADREARVAVPSLRWALVTGEACAGELCRRWLDQHPVIPLVNAYGPTECSDDVTHYVMATRPDAAMMVAPIGRPVGNTRLYVLNAAMAPVPAGVAGELYVGGDGVGRGYWQRAALTADRFVPDGFGPTPGMRLYGTGDLARYTDQGVLEFLGRTDTQVKIRGYRIELEEIEARLRAHAAVQSAVVVAREVGGDMRLVAYYTGTEPPVTDEAEALRVHLAAILPEYMVPAAYVRLAALPLTLSGKVDRKALPVPDASAYATGGYEAPDGPIETALAAIWADVLHVDRVGRHDNFFALGGHSLLAMTLVEHMRQHGFAVDVGRLFVTPTIAQLTLTLDAPVEMVSVPENRIPGIPTSHHGLSQIEVRI